MGGIDLSHSEGSKEGRGESNFGSDRAQILYVVALQLLLMEIFHILVFANTDRLESQHAIGGPKD